MVATVDGAAAAGGVTATISTAADRAVFRVLRAVCDAVLVGAGTARAESYGPAGVPPGLAEWRAEHGLAPAPVMVQVTRSGAVHTGRDMFHPQGRAAIVTSTDDPAVLARLAQLAGPDDVIRAPGEGGVDVATMLRGLAERGWRRVLCEGGPSLLGRMLAVDAVDELCVTSAPVLAPGPAPRIVEGVELSPRGLLLSALAESDSTLLARWRRSPRASGELT
jgi:riboflavin biosynthesis pyrimidine reductase